MHKHRFIRSAAVAALTLIGFATASAATLTGVTVNPAKATVGEKIEFKITASGNSCAAKFVLNGFNYYASPNTKEVNGVYSNSPGAIGTTTLLGGLPNPGTYPIVVTGMTGGAIEPCQGTVQTTLVVEPKPTISVVPAVIAFTPPQPLNCAMHYDELASDKAAGEIQCRKQLANCPENFTGSVDMATGKLTCTPKPATCPDGWQGGMQGGILVCNPVPQPTITCPNQTATWKWGTAYYKNGWRIYGCVKNLEPPK